jgi:hypothetical protein
VTTWQQFASSTNERKIFSREEREVGEGFNKIFFLRHLRVLRATFLNSWFSRRFSIAQRPVTWEISGLILN